MATKKSQRVAIWVIAIVMAVGTLGAYFIVILENNNAQRDQEAYNKQLEESAKAQMTVDPTAFKVDGKVTELKTEDLVVGAGAEVKTGDKVRVHYKGTVAQSQLKFDSSYDRGEPAEFTLDENSVIKGWVQGMQGMKEGGKRRIIIPSSLAYGETGNPPTIDPNTDLVFEVELVKVNPTGQ